MKIVSAIITTRNRSNLLKRAIESVLSQTYKELECIVVDDNSTDDTRKVCSNYPVKYIYIPQEESCGGNYARNLGAKSATGYFIAYLDDDDWWMPTKIEKQVKLAEAQESGLIYCLREWHTPTSERVSYEGLSYIREGDLGNIIFRHYITSTSCLLIRKDLFFEVGGFDEQLRKWQEYELMMRLCKVTKVYCVHEYLVGYLIDNTDKQKLSNKAPLAKESIRYIYQKHKHDILKNKYTFLCFLNMSVCELYQVSVRTGDIQQKWKYGLWALPSMFYHRIKAKIIKIWSK